MSLIRRAGTALGLTALALALVAVFTGLDLHVRSLVDMVGSDYLLVALLAAGACIVVLATAVSARGTGRFQASVPDPERPFSAPTPGADFDEISLAWRASLPVLGRSRRRAVRDRLRATALETLSKAEHCDRAEAERLLDRGSWTDDPWARSFLGAGAGPSIRQRLVALSAGEPWFRRHVVRTVDALDEVETGNRPEEP